MHEKTKDHVGVFLAGVVLLSAPLWLLAAQDQRQIMPGLPLSGLMAFAPAVAALTLALALHGGRGARALAVRSVDLGPGRALAWLLLAVAFMPAIRVAAYCAQAALGETLPAPVFDPRAMALGAVAFLVAAWGEELGWSAYALDPLRERLGMAAAALLLGVFWAVWHWIPFLQAGRSIEWIAWQSLGIVATRVVMVWLYFRSGRSVVAVTVFHAADNVAWQAFPVAGSHYDPRVNAVLMGAVALCLLAGMWSSPCAGQRRPRGEVKGAGSARSSSPGSWRGVRGSSYREARFPSLFR